MPAPVAMVRGEPAGHLDRELDPRHLRSAARRRRHLDRPRLVHRHPRRRLLLRDPDLPSQDQLIWTVRGQKKERPMRTSTGRSFIPVGDVGIEGDEHAHTSRTLCTAGWGWSGLAGDARRRCPTTRSRGCYDDDSGWRNALVVSNLGRRGRGESGYGATDLVSPWAEAAPGHPVQGQQRFEIRRKLVSVVGLYLNPRRRRSFDLQARWGEIRLWSDGRVARSNFGKATRTRFDPDHDTPPTILDSCDLSGSRRTACLKSPPGCRTIKSGCHVTASRGAAAGSEPVRQRAHTDPSPAKLSSACRPDQKHRSPDCRLPP